MNPACATPTPATTGHTKLLTIEKAASLISWLENTSFKCGEYELDGVTPSQTDEYNDLLGKCITARNEVKAAFGLLIAEAASLRESHARLLEALKLADNALMKCEGQLWMCRDHFAEGEGMEGWAKHCKEDALVAKEARAAIASAQLTKETTP